MTRRQAKLPIAHRIIAAGCVVLWLAGVSACNLEALFCCPSHEGETAAPEDHEHSRDTKVAVAGTDHEHDADADHSHHVEAHHSEDADGHSSDSHKHESKEGPCCSTLKAVAQTAKPAILGKPAIFDHIPSFVVPLETHAVSPAHWMDPLNLPATCWDRVISPEVCLGPAFQSNAPPAFG